MMHHPMATRAHAGENGRSVPPPSSSVFARRCPCRVNGTAASAGRDPCNRQSGGGLEFGGEVEVSRRVLKTSTVDRTRGRAVAVVPPRPRRLRLRCGLRPWCVSARFINYLELAISNAARLRFHTTIR